MFLTQIVPFLWELFITFAFEKLNNTKECMLKVEILDDDLYELILTGKNNKGKYNLVSFITSN